MDPFVGGILVGIPVGAIVTAVTAVIFRSGTLAKLEDAGEFPEPDEKPILMNKIEPEHPWPAPQPGRFPESQDCLPGPRFIRGAPNV